MKQLDWPDIDDLAARLEIPYETWRKWRQRRIPPAWRMALLALLNDRRRGRQYADAHLPRGKRER